MINALWLLLIVPAAAFFGFAFCAILSINRDMEDDEFSE